MRTIFGVLVAVFAVSAFFVFSRFSSSHKKATFPATGYFGSGDPHPDDTTIKPFKIQVPDSAIQELKKRLSQARIGHKQLENVQDFSYGMNLESVLKFKEYWQTKYDWRKAEAELNSFPQFKTEIEGLQIHFLDVQPPAGKYKRVIPLLLVHGWPGNVYEFHKIISILTDPKKVLQNFDGDFAFRVVAPSIPGYGWSDSPRQSGWNTVSSARVFVKLMDRLKLGKFVAQGGDWGSAIALNVARMYPEKLYGVHVNMMFLTASPTALFKMVVGTVAPSLVFADSRFHNFHLGTVLLNFIKESGYMHIQATKPDTVGVALNDSPVGLMTYILEKFSTWTNPAFVRASDGGLLKKYTMDELLTIVSIYWFNGNIVNSQRFYKENFGNEKVMEVGYGFVSAPTGYAGFPHDLIPPLAPEIVKTGCNLTHVNYYDDGGHFAAFEVPSKLAKDVFVFVQNLDTR